jgi:hypothetical protein
MPIDDSDLSAGCFLGLKIIFFLAFLLPTYYIIKVDAANRAFFGGFLG